MRRMPIELVYGTVPTTTRADMQRTIDIMVGGNLTETEQSFVDRAVKHNWTVRVIVDELRAMRGMVEVPYDFNWQSLRGKS
jgi:hypothetical protein